MSNPDLVTIPKREYKEMKQHLSDAIIACHEREAEIERLNHYIDRLENADQYALIKQLEARLWAAESRAQQALHQRDDLIDELNKRVTRQWESVIPTKMECETLLRQLGPYIIENFNPENNYVIINP